ncbi:MAG: transposase, partial [Thermoplasmata archaeon]
LDLSKFEADIRARGEDFRVGNRTALDGLLTQVLAVLMKEGLLELKRVAQDGMRVRASAGAASFRREKSLDRCMEEAKAQVEALARETDSDQTAVREAARRRAAADRLLRIERAIEEMPKARESKKPEDRSEARVSTTDPEARVMKMPDGGFRPAYNFQFCTDTDSRVVTGVSVDNRGSDMGHVDPMLDQIESRTGLVPGEHLVDGGYVRHEDMQKAADRNVTVYAPIPTPRNRTADPHQPRPLDLPAIAEWRVRMAAPDAKEIYKERASTAETVNANLRCLKGLDRLLIRTIPKVLCVALWAVLAYDIGQMITLT